MTDERGQKESPAPLSKKVYEKELYRLQAELVRVQTWVRATNQRLVVLFEGRDAAGKGGTISRITHYLNPRFARIVALPVPTERQRGQWYFQRYVEQLPAAGEMVLFDRSWYNRAGVERVMGFCTDDEYRLFVRQAPIFERMLIEDGILLRSTGSVSVSRNRRDGFDHVWTIRSAAGSCRRWMPSPSSAGRTTPGPRTRCSSSPTFRKVPGTSWRPTINVEHVST